MPDPRPAREHMLSSPQPHEYRPTDIRDIERHRDAPDDAPEPEPSAAEREATNDLIAGKLGDRDIYVPPVKAWRSSALHSLRQGDFDTWAQVTLSDDDWDIWAEMDPTLGQIEEFFETVNTGLGTNPGNSRASRRQQARTRRR